VKWDSIRLGDVMEVKHGYAFDGRYFADAGEYVLLTPGNCHESGGLKLKGDKEKYFTGEFPPEFLLNEGDMLVVMTDLINRAPILGGSFLIPEGSKYLHNQRLGLVQVTDEKRIDRMFLHYLLNTHEYRGQVRGSASGATVRHTSPGRIKACRVRIPADVSYQSRVGAALAAYDDLIENNRRRMKLLEDAARLLYQEWFVRLRFPGHERVRVKDGVPEGWLRKRIGDIADCVGGGTPSTTVPAYWEDGTVTWVTPTDVTRNQHFVLLDTEKRITEAGLNNSSAKLVPPHTVLMTSRASVGFFAVAGREVCTNQGFISIVPQDAALSTYLLFHLSERVEEIRAMGSGSTYPEVSRGKFRELSVVTPPTRLVADFDEQATLLLRHIRVLKQQNEKLRAARDLLLPRLMSGEVNVSRKDRNATEIHS
jgi:type I restriction enzyme S subunit